MKSCTCCQKLQPLENFYTDKRTKDGSYSSCKDCHQRKYNALRNQKNKKRSKPTPRNVAGKYLTNIKVRVGVYPAYRNTKNYLSREVLQNWLEQRWDEYMNLYEIWEKSGFDRKTVPTLDRIDPKKHYEIANIQLLPFSLNASRAHKGKKYGSRVSEEGRERLRRSTKARWANGLLNSGILKRKRKVAQLQNS